jgi:receptor expression-enhancing protein 5/6
VLGGGAVFTLLIFFGVGAGVLCSIVGFVYPAFKSFETIETKTKGDDIQWLVYWVVFAFFSLIETFRDFLLYWIPFYYAFKLAFLLWAMLPQTKGAKFLYDSFLKDFLKKSESRIDAAMAESKKVRLVVSSSLSLSMCSTLLLDDISTLSSSSPSFSRRKQLPQSWRGLLPN